MDVEILSRLQFAITIITSLPLDAPKEYVGTFRNVINSYAILVGITTVALFLMHGTL